MFLFPIGSFDNSKNVTCDFDIVYHTCSAYTVRVIQLFLWSNVVYQIGSLWHEMGKIHSDNKGSGTGQSLPVAVVVGSRTERWEVTVL